VLTGRWSRSSTASTPSGNPRKAYVASQRHEGWACIPDRFDGGGLTAVMACRADVATQARVTARMSNPEPPSGH